MLTIYRRHLDTCTYKAKGRRQRNCECPIHCDGFVKGKRVRQSLDTVNWARAKRRLSDLEDEIIEGKVTKSVPEAADAFLIDRKAGASTGRKYRRIMARLREFATAKGIKLVNELTLEHLDTYRTTRMLNELSWSKELQLLRTFFGFCLKRKWCSENPAKEMTMPADPKPKAREPYTADEITRIYAACDSFGKSAYERLRAKAMI